MSSWCVCVYVALSFTCVVEGARRDRIDVCDH